MQPLINFKRLLLAFMLVILAVVQSTAQISHEVIRGEVYALGVVDVPGETYEWKVYSNFTLMNESGQQDVVFLTNNFGHQVAIKWLKSGTYYFTVTAQSQTGCMNLKVGMITVVDEQNLSPSISITPDKNPICKGTLVTFTAKIINEGKNPVFVWLKNGIHVGHNLPTYADSILVDKDVISCNLISNVKDAGTVTIKSDEIKMVVSFTKAEFTITENFGYMNGNIIFNNTSTGADTYYWDFGNGQTSTEINPSHTYTKDGTYLILLTAMNKLNCSDTFSYKYEMLFKGLYIPNAFAPGATTTLGSVFQPAGISLKRYKIEVYDNWGHMMWESSALDNNGTPTESWDGTYHGKPMPQGTYLWKVHAVFLDDSTWQGSDNGAGKGSAIGTVLLIR